MTLNKIKKSSKQRLSFPQSLNSSPNSSFIMNGLKKSQVSKEDQKIFFLKKQVQSFYSGPKSNSKTKKYLINKNTSQKKERNSSNSKSLSFLNNLTSKISYSKIEENKREKYIFNSPKNQSPETIYLKKKRNSSQVVQNKTSAKKTLLQNDIKNSNLYVKNRFSINQIQKLKKKKINQSKNLNKTYFQQRKSTSKLQNNGVEGLKTRLSLKPCYDENNQFTVSYKNSLINQNMLNQTKQIQEFSIINSQDLQNLRAHSATLYKNLPTKQRQNLTHITNGYQKIVGELSLLLSKKSNKNLKLNQIAPEFQRFSMNHKFVCQRSTENSSSIQTESNTNFSTPQNSPKKFKKLQNLQKLRHTFSIKSYHEQFMDNRQEFSESWKRQLNKEKQF